MSTTTDRLPIGTLLQAVNERLLEAEIDSRTGVFNVRYFEQKLVERVAMALRMRGHLSLVRIDLDHFKPLNDTFGHIVCDELLTELGGLFGLRARTDCVARVGGEEFAVLLWGTNLDGAKHKAEQLRNDIEVSLSAWLSERTGQPGRRFTASFGVATLTTTTLNK